MSKYRSRWWPALALLLLAPWVAECSWGGFTAVDFLPVVVFLAPMYGGAAVLIRETARRTGGGWPAIVLLAAAFGVLQAGLVDQSLFNQSFLDDTEFAEQAVAARGTTVPWLDVSAEQAFDYVGNHIMLSICAPIAIVESFAGPGTADRYRPWLGRGALTGVAVLYVLGSLLIFTDARGDFFAAPEQVAVAVAAVALLIGAALRRRRDRPAPRPGAVPRPVRIGFAVLAAHLGVTLVSGWAGVGVRMIVAALVASAVVVLSRRAAWSQRHVLAVCGAGMVAAAGFAYLVPNYAPASPAAALTGDIVVSLVTAALLGGAFWRLRTQDRAPRQSSVGQLPPDP